MNKYLKDDKLLGFDELYNDKYFSKIPKEKYEYYVQESYKIGLEYAEKFKNKDLKEESRKLGFVIEYVEGSIFNKTDIEIRAHIIIKKNEKKIRIYKESVHKMTEVLKGILTEKQVYDLHIAHEFFHVLEYLDNNIVSEKMEPIIRLRLFGKEYYGFVSASSEIAAHCFAKKVLDLEYNPKAYDYMYMLNRNKMSIIDFEEYFKDLKTIFEGVHTNEN